MDEEKTYWIGFSAFPGIGPIRFGLLYEYFGSAKSAWYASKSELLSVHLGEKLTTSFLHFRDTFDLDEYLQKLHALSVKSVIKIDPKFPIHLKDISDAPFVLYVKGSRGSIPIDVQKTVAVVGTRQVTPYGRDVTQKIVRELVEAGCTIVSGLALGVDAIAHQSALDAGGQTIAVLGCGVDIIAPSSNASIYEAIVTSGRGAVVGEIPLGMRPSKGLFPARNRIISGLSKGVVVTEGADDSGALITARYAAEQGREVFAIPGAITSPYSRGPAKLIKQGAQLVESADDILDVLGFSPNKKGSIQNRKLTNHWHDEKEQKIGELLMEGALHVDDIIRSSGLPTSVVVSTLTIMEMSGRVKDLGEKVYRLE